MPTVFVNIGSNIEPRLHIKNSLSALRKRFGALSVSKCYESQAVGFDGDNFLNLSASFSTDLNVTDVNTILHQIEDEAGRERLNGKAWDSRTLDIDILLYGDICGEVDGIELPRSEIVEFAHVLLPLCELAGNKIHPKLGISFAALSLQTEFTGQSIWEISL